MADSEEADSTGTMKLLRNGKFQKLLLEYQRAHVPFLVGYEVQDSVSSKDGFDNTPLLQGRGGVARARPVFSELDLLVPQLNDAVAA